MTGYIKPGEPVARLAVSAPVKRPVSKTNDSIAPDDLLAAMMDDMWNRRPVNALSLWWFEKGVLRAIRRGEALDCSLSLGGVGKSTLQARLAMIRRNECLAAAAAAIAFDDGVSQWQRCLRLAPEVERFMGVTWPKTKRLAAPPAHWPTFKQCLWFAACFDLGLPEKAGGLRYALQQNTRYSLNPAGATLIAQYL